MKSQHRARLKEVVDVVFAGNEAEAARAARVPQQTLNRILTGKTKMPTLVTLQKLADAFGLTVGWLTGAESEVQGAWSSQYPNWFWLLYMYERQRKASDLSWLAKLKPKTEARRQIKAKILRDPKEKKPPSQSPLSLLMGERIREAGKLPTSYIPPARAAMNARIQLLEIVVKEFKRLSV